MTRIICLKANSTWLSQLSLSPPLRHITRYHATLSNEPLTSYNSAIFSSTHFQLPFMVTYVLHYLIRMSCALGALVSFYLISNAFDLFNYSKSKIHQCFNSLCAISYCSWCPVKVGHGRFHGGRRIRKFQDGNLSQIMWFKIASTACAQYCKNPSLCSSTVNHGGLCVMHILLAYCSSISYFTTLVIDLPATWSFNELSPHHHHQCIITIVDWLTRCPPTLNSLIPFLHHHHHEIHYCHLSKISLFYYTTAAELLGKRRFSSLLLLK